LSRAFDSMLVRWVCAIAAVIALGAAAVGSSQTSSTAGRVVVELKDGESVEEFCGRHGLTLVDSIPQTSLLVEADAASLAEAAADDAIASTQPDLPTLLSETAILSPAVVALLDPEMVSALKDPQTIWNGRNVLKRSAVRQRGLQRIKADDALEMADGSGIIVAVLDTGIDATHPGLIGSVLPGFNFLADDTNTDELSGLPASIIEALRATSAAPGSGLLSLLNPSTVALLDPAAISFLNSPPLYFGHGTLVSGLIHLIAPGAMILPVKAFDTSGTSTSFRVAKAIRYAADRGAHVINMSFDMDQYSPLVSEALDYAAGRGVILIASVGNKNSLVNSNFPASHPAVIGVAATNRDDRKAKFSNHGGVVKVAAPGDGLISMYPGGLYAGVGGTSFAAAMVSGQAALIRSKSTAPAADIMRFILDTTDPVVGLTPGMQLGTGRINARDALRELRPR
jgi:subtilisin family serine protease